MKKILFLVLFSLPGFGATEYFALFFAYNGVPDIPSNSHNFASFAQSKDGRVTAEDVITISWDAEEKTRPFADVPGKNWSLKDTFKRAGTNQVQYFGPFQINESLFEKANAKHAFLVPKNVRYRMTDAMTRELPFKNEPGGSVNCHHSVTDILGWYEAEKNLWGVDATREIVRFFIPELIDYPKVYPNVWEQVRAATWN